MMGPIFQEPQACMCAWSEFKHKGTPSLGPTGMRFASRHVGSRPPFFLGAKSIHGMGVLMFWVVLGVEQLKGSNW